MQTVFRLAAVFAAVAIAVLSLQPGGGTAVFPHIDKLQHLVAYGTLAGLIGLGWPRLRLVWVVAVAALFGAGVEIAQGLAGTGRFMSVADALANTAGAGLAALALDYLRRR